MKVTIFDYGAGNIHSLAKALEVAGGDVRVEPDPVQALATDLFVLPGVGAFATATRRLGKSRDRVRDTIVGGLPTLGICLGMQILFESSEEGGGAGLGVLSGVVTKLDAARTPQIGWNAIEDSTDPALRAAGLSQAYFANGFACRPVNAEAVVGWTTHERDRFPAIVRRGATVGVQFHPEKSSTRGIAFLRALLDEVRP
jgi:imidazole glycerol-phosphate synthase subunit HisH